MTTKYPRSPPPPFRSTSSIARCNDDDENDDGYAEVGGKRDAIYVATFAIAAVCAPVCGHPLDGVGWGRDGGPGGPSVRISIIDSAECSCRTILPAAASRRSRVCVCARVRMCVCVRVARQCAPVSSIYRSPSLSLSLSLSVHIPARGICARARARARRHVSVCGPLAVVRRAAARGAGVGVRGAIESLRHRCPRRMDVSCQRETCDRARPLSGDLGRPSATSAECLSRVKNRVAYTCDTGERVDTTDRVACVIIRLLQCVECAGGKERGRKYYEDGAIKTIRIDCPLCDPSIRPFVRFYVAARRDMQCRNSRLS